MNTPPTLSIVVPVFNAETFIEPFHAALLNTLNQIAQPFEIIYVDDNSTDDSLATIQQIAFLNKANITLLALHKNEGQYTATLCGIKQAKGNLILTIDDDNTPSPSCIPLLFNALQPNHELLYGEFKQSNQSVFRKLSSELFNSIIRNSTNHKTPSNKSGSSFRLIKTSLAEKVLEHISNPILLDIELIKCATGTIKFIEIPFENTLPSPSSHSLFKLLNYALKIFSALLLNTKYFRQTFNPNNSIRTIEQYPCNNP